jgi:hypothetical protein
MYLEHNKKNSKFEDFLMKIGNIVTEYSLLILILDFDKISANKNTTTCVYN